MTAYRVHLMSPQDVPGVAALAARVLSPDWGERDFEASRLSALDGIWVVDNSTSDGPVGFIHVRTVAGEGEILNVAVAPEMQGQGLGRMLVKHALEHFAQSGGTSLCLEVRASNVPAIALYKSSGFSQVGIRRGYYPGQPTELDSNPDADSYSSLGPGPGAGAREDALVFTRRLKGV